MTALNGTLCFTLSGALLFASHLVAVQRDFISTVFGGDQVTSAEHGRYNVLLLGGDAGPKRVGIRPDSLTVASIDEQTGRTVLLGLPRNLRERAVPARHGHASAVPQGLSLHGLLPQRHQHVGQRAPGTVSPRQDARHHRHDASRRGDHRVEHQLLRADRPQGLPGPGRCRGRGHGQREGAHPDRWRRRADQWLDRARSPAPRRLPDAVVLTQPRDLGRLLADGAAEVRDERDAAPAQARPRCCPTSARSPGPANRSSRRRSPQVSSTPS